MPEPDRFLRYRIGAGTRNFMSRKSHVHVLAAWFFWRAVVLKWFYSLSCRITSVGGTCDDDDDDDDDDRKNMR